MAHLEMTISGLIHNKCFVTLERSRRKVKFGLFLFEHYFSLSCVGN
jgi:hypothetical protein